MVAKKSAAKPLLSTRQRASIRRTAKDDPSAAKRMMADLAIVETGLRECAKLDGITNSPNRRRPMNRVYSLDYEFKSQRDRDTMVATVRDLCTNFSLTRGILQTNVNNVAGNGPRLQMNTADSEYNERFETWWAKWAKTCDVGKTLDFGRMVRVGFWDGQRDGDAAVVIRENDDAIRLQGITGDRIANPPKADRAGKDLIYGIEVNADTAPVAMNVWKNSKRNNRANFAGRVDWDDVCFIFDPENFEQRRGISKFLSAITDNQDVREILEANKGTMKLENWLGVFIKKHASSNAEVTPFGQGSQYDAGNGDGTASERRQFSVAPGININELGIDEDVVSLKKETPNNNFENSILFQARLAGLVCGMPLEIALQYYTKGSYATLKGAIRQYHGVVVRERECLEWQVCDKVLDRVQAWAHEAWVRSGGKMGVEPPAATVNTDPHAWQWPMLNNLEPDKQERADSARYALGKDSLDSQAKRENRSWRDTAEQRILEIKEIQEMATKEGVDPNLVLPRSSVTSNAPVTEGEEEGEE